MRRAEILSSAAKIVTGRDIQHGDVENSFPRIAQMWSAYKGVEFTPVDVTVMLILLKVARISSGHQNSDNFIDIAGYAACGGELQAHEHTLGGEVDSGYAD